MRLEPGMISSPLLLSGNNGCLLRCTQRTDLGYDSYEEVKNSIILEEAQKVLQASIEERVQDASVFFVSDKYEQIIVE